MASRFYALDMGLSKTSVLEGAATQSQTVEIAVLLDDAPSKSEVMRLLEELQAYIMEDIWPPA